MYCSTCAVAQNILSTADLEHGLSGFNASSYRCKPCQDAIAAKAKALKVKEREAAATTAAHELQRMDKFEDGLLADFSFSQFPFGPKGAALSTEQLVNIFDTTNFQRLGARVLRLLYKGTQPVHTLSLDVPLWCWRVGACQALHDIAPGNVTVKGGDGAQGNTLFYNLKPATGVALSSFDFLFDTGSLDRASWRKGRRCWVCAKKPCNHICKVERIAKITYDTTDQLLEVTIHISNSCI
jgi:hypothetical protein